MSIINLSLYNSKYLKYKNKYLTLKKMFGGTKSIDEMETFVKSCYIDEVLSQENWLAGEILKTHLTKKVLLKQEIEQLKVLSRVLSTVLLTYNIVPNPQPNHERFTKEYLVRTKIPESPEKLKEEIDKLLQNISRIKILLKEMSLEGLPEELPKKLPKELPKELPEELPEELPKELSEELFEKLKKNINKQILKKESSFRKLYPAISVESVFEEFNTFNKTHDMLLAKYKSVDSNDTVLTELYNFHKKIIGLIPWLASGIDNFYNSDDRLSLRYPFINFVTNNEIKRSRTLINILVNKDIVINTKNDNNLVALDYCIIKNNTECHDLLLEKGAVKSVNYDRLLRQSKEDKKKEENQYDFDERHDLLYDTDRKAFDSADKYNASFDEDNASDDGILL